MILADRIALALADGKRARDIAEELGITVGMVKAVRRDRNLPAHWQIKRYSTKRVERQFAAPVDCPETLATEDPLEQPAGVDALWSQALHGLSFDAFKIPAGALRKAPRRETFVPAAIGVGALA